ncbi:hypothetical protein V8E51_000356 [Hyaloscypha variabilis]
MMICVPLLVARRFLFLQILSAALQTLVASCLTMLSVAVWVVLGLGAVIVREAFVVTLFSSVFIS